MFNLIVDVKVHEYANIWETRNTVFVDCNVQSHSGCQSSFDEYANIWETRNCVSGDSNV